MSEIVLYGIPNCDTIKKARKFLDSRQLEYRFHDYKKLGVPAQKLKSWCRQFGFENVINRRGTTWRKLDEQTRETLNESSALAIMQQQPSIIKRPVLERGDKVLIGFDQSEYESLL